MTIGDQIEKEKLQYDVNRFNKYEYLTGEEVLPSNKRQIIEQANFTYSPLGKLLKNN